MYVHQNISFSTGWYSVGGVGGIDSKTQTNLNLFELDGVQTYTNLLGFGPSIHHL